MIDEVNIPVKAVELKLIINPEEYQNTAGNSDRQTNTLMKNELF